MRYRPGRTKQEEIGIGWINKRKITKVYKIPIGLAQKEGGGEEGYFESRSNSIARSREAGHR
jgi:hypothetical protein